MTECYMIHTTFKTFLGLLMCKGAICLLSLTLILSGDLACFREASPVRMTDHSRWITVCRNSDTHFKKKHRNYLCPLDYRYCNCVESLSLCCLGGWQVSASLVIWPSLVAPESGIDFSAFDFVCPVFPYRISQKTGQVFPYHVSQKTGHFSSSISLNELPTLPFNGHYYY